MRESYIGEIVLRSNLYVAIEPFSQKWRLGDTFLRQEKIVWSTVIGMSEGALSTICFARHAVPGARHLLFLKPTLNYLNNRRKIWIRSSLCRCYSLTGLKAPFEDSRLVENYLTKFCLRAVLERPNQKYEKGHLRQLKRVHKMIWICDLSRILRQVRPLTDVCSN